jgi:hypothetical protein
MARLLLEGFEGGGAPLGWSLKDVNIQSSTGCDGAYCAQFTSGFGHMIYPFPAGLSEIYVYFKHKILGTTTYNWNTISFFKYPNPWDASGWLAEVRLKASTYVLQAYNGKLTTWLAEGATGMLPTGTWRHIEIYYKPDATNGRFVIKVDGNIEVDFTGNTNNSAGTTIYGIGFGNPLGNAYTNSNGCIDNVIVDDAEWIKPDGQTQFPRISAIKPAAAGTYSQWNGAYGDVDDIPPDDADGLIINSADQISSFSMSSIVGSVDTIKAVQLDAYIRGQGDFTPKNVKPMIRTGGADYLGSDRPVPYIGKSHYARKLWQVNPQTGVAWTPSEIAALECGVKSAA